MGFVCQTRSVSVSGAICCCQPWLKEEVQIYKSVLITVEVFISKNAVGVVQSASFRRWIRVFLWKMETFGYFWEGKAFTFFKCLLFDLYRSTFQLAHSALLWFNLHNLFSWTGYTRCLLYKRFIYIAYAELINLQVNVLPRPTHINRTCRAGRAKNKTRCRCGK